MSQPTASTWRHPGLIARTDVEFSEALVVQTASALWAYPTYLMSGFHAPLGTQLSARQLRVDIERFGKVLSLIDPVAVHGLVNMPNSDYVFFMTEQGLMSHRFAHGVLELAHTRGQALLAGRGAVEEHLANLQQLLAAQQ